MAGTIYKKHLLLITLLPLGIILTWLFSQVPEMVERIYSCGFYRMFGQVLSTLTGFISISVAELLIMTIILVLGCIAVIKIFSIRKSIFNNVSVKGKTVLIMAIISVIYFSFLVVWGFNYYRLPLVEVAGLDTADISDEEVEELCKDLIKQANELRKEMIEDAGGVMVCSSHKYEVLGRACQGYGRAALIYPELGGSYGNPKAVVLSDLMSSAGLSGIFFPFTGEANVNIEIPAPILPAITCHEMAHQRGFAREDEANYLAYFTCRRHPDSDFQYSGTLLALIYSMNALSSCDYSKYLELKQEYGEGVKRDLSAVTEFWQQHQGPVLWACSRLNNLYLKSNHQEEGIRSYGRMVDLLIGEKRTVNK